MAIPNDYIDKITNKDSGESRIISPAADKVRVDNENFEGTDLDEVLDEVAQAIGESGSGDGTVTGVKMNNGQPIAPDENGVVDLGTVITDVSNKVDKVTGYGLSKNDYTDADKTAVATIPSKANDADVVKSISVNNVAQQKNNGNVNISTPTKTSDLINDRGFVTAESLDGIVAGSADFVITEDDDYIYINPVIPTLSVVGAVVVSESTKSGTFKVSGTNLKGDVTVAITAANWSLSANGSSGQSLTLHPESGVLAETTITATYSGSSDSTANTITISSQGAASVSTSASYTVYAGPTIIADTSASISAVGGASNSVDIVVAGANLTGDIAATLNDNTGKFSISPASISQSGGAASGTLHITYSPSAGDTGTHSASIVLSSAGATSVTINITGTVLVQSLSISPASLELQSASGTSVDGTIKVIGENLTNAVALSVGSGFSLSPASISAETVNAAGSTGVDVTVTADTTVASGTVTAASGTVTASASVSWSVQEETPSVGDVITKGGLKFKVSVAADGDTPGKLKVVNGDGEEPSSYQVATNKYTMSSLVIPDSVTYAGKTYNVTSVGKCAFGGCTNIQSISVGQNVVTLFNYAFYGCKNTSLNSIILPASVQNVFDFSLQETKIARMTFLNPTSLSLSDNMTAASALETTTTYCDFGEGYSALKATTGKMKNLSTLILRRTSGVVSCTKGAGWTSFYGRSEKKNEVGATYVPTTVYVPSNLLTSYSSDSNWATWVSAGVITLDTIENLAE